MATTSRTGPARCRRKFLRFFPGGFRDGTYLDWERDYKWATHKRWAAALGEAEFARLLKTGDLRRSTAGAERFALGVFDYLHCKGRIEDRFAAWVEAVDSLPRKQTRVLTWPLVTVFGFIAKPRAHIFLKPTVTRLAAEAYGFDLHYVSRPNWDTYRSLLEFARRIRSDMKDLAPRDMIDVQSFMWVQGSSEYD
jgi:hypothetical protein